MDIRDVLVRRWGLGMARPFSAAPTEPLDCPARRSQPEATRFDALPGGHTVCMARSAIGPRAERSKRRQRGERSRWREHDRRNGLNVSGERDGDAWALYLLDRDFHGLPLDAHIRTRSSR